MFDIKSKTDDELNALICDIIAAMDTVVVGIDQKVDAIMKTQIGPFMIEAIQEILILRLRHRNAQEIQELQRELIDILMKVSGDKT